MCCKLPEAKGGLGGFYLDSFKAEAKRSWFSLRQSLKGATSKGKLWLPATVTLTDGRLRVSTTEWTSEFRPRKLVWKGHDRFLVVGLNKSSELQRSFLRFKTAEEASRAASAVKEIGVVIEEPLSPVEEIQVQVRFLYTLGEMFVLTYVLSIRLLILGFIALVVSSVLGFGPFVPAVLIVLYVVVYVWGLLERTRRRTGAWLRFEGKSFAVRTEHDWWAMVPRAIEWKSSESFVLKGSGTKVHVSLPTGDDAARVVQRLRSSFPEIKEAPLKPPR